MHERNFVSEYLRFVNINIYISIYIYICCWKNVCSIVSHHECMPDCPSKQHQPLRIHLLSLKVDLVTSQQLELCLLCFIRRMHFYRCLKKLILQLRSKRINHKGNPLYLVPLMQNHRCSKKKYLFCFIIN